MVLTNFGLYSSISLSDVDAASISDRDEAAKKDEDTEPLTN